MPRPRNFAIIYDCLRHEIPKMVTAFLDFAEDVRDDPRAYCALVVSD